MEENKYINPKSDNIIDIAGSNEYINTLTI